MKKAVLFATLLGVFTAQTAFATVRINEIAWMGTSASASDEWIELYSDSATATDLFGWTFKGKDGSPSVALSGSIAANGYYLIERKSDDSVPNVSADLVASFGRGLSNSGETLILSDASGTAVDTVVGGTNWAKVGGDNKTKETAQRDLSGWFTAAPTPRASNVRPKALPPAPQPPPPQKTSSPKTVSPSAPSPRQEKGTTTTTSPVRASSNNAANVLWQRTDEKSSGSEWLWVIAAVLLAVVAVTVLVRTNIPERSDADLYTIIDESEKEE